MRILRVNLNAQWMGALFNGQDLFRVLDGRLSWMEALSPPEIREVLRVRKAKYHWVDLDGEVKRDQTAEHEIGLIL